jgi:acyl carrier protein
MSAYMTLSSEALSRITQALQSHVKRPLDSAELQESTDLVAIGLDSISIVEFLLACEDRFGVPIAPLLDGQPVTLGRVAAHFSDRG